MDPVADDISDNDAVVTNDPAISSSSSLTSSSDAELYDEAGLKFKYIGTRPKDLAEAKRKYYSLQDLMLKI
ncbi:unnamed protein product [Adineta steineri]|uniref:Uncharacterized protein n=1 Tax=Adineta steineri TaxID=433720 RepID=A0A819ZDV9_9BILA|nr:unnamed protein product [Adineta steineri]CAF4161843.1 unnamed protein product [Adineta steineri]